MNREPGEVCVERFRVKERSAHCEPEDPEWPLDTGSTEGAYIGA